MPLSEAVLAAVALSQEQLIGKIDSAMTTLFSSMVGLEITPVEPRDEQLTEFNSSISAMIGLAGTYSGIISVHCSQRVAMAITGGMLGMAVEEMGSDVADAIGEIANMIGGEIKQLLSRGGLDVHLSIPTVMWGEQYFVDAIEAGATLVLPYEIDGERCLVGLKVKKEA